MTVPATGVGVAESGGPGPAGGGPASARYRVEVTEETSGATVRIVDVLDGSSEVFARVCSSRREAEALRSVIEQHLRWLSEEPFRGYYRIAAEAR